jgi:hypothetical protein
VLEAVRPPFVAPTLFPQIRSLFHGFRASLSFAFLSQKTVEQLRKRFSLPLPACEIPINGRAELYAFGIHSREVTRMRGVDKADKVSRPSLPAVCCALVTGHGALRAPRALRA